MGIETYVSTRSTINIKNARRADAIWASDAANKRMPVKLDAAIIFPPAGNLVEPALSQVEKGGTLVLAPVSASPIEIDGYSKNLWGRSIKTLNHLKMSNAESYIGIVGELEAVVGTILFPFEESQDALILVKQGKLKQPNTVIKIAE